MLKRLLISSSIICLTTCVAKADDKLDSAMKRIAELEAKNKSLEQSNKEKDSLLKKQRINVSELHTKTSSRPALLPVANLSTSEPAPVSEINYKNSLPALSGVYFGINGGYGGGDIVSSTNIIISSAQLSGTSQSASRLGGPLAGGQIGYNFLISKQFMLGLETDFDWSNVSNQNGGTTNFFGPATYQTNGQAAQNGLSWVGSTRLRTGYLLGSFMPYLTGGVAYGMSVAQAQLNSIQPINSGAYIQWSNSNLSKISAGWVAGAGVEYGVDQNWSLKTEYLYTQVGSAPPNITTFVFSPGQTPFASVAYGQISQFGVHQIRFGLNFHPHLFEEPAPSIIAKY
jgi:outer membrane immunogenic protein